MAEQYRNKLKGDDLHKETVEDGHLNETLNIQDDVFESSEKARQVYDQICFEYNQKLTPMYASIRMAREGFPPYWDDQQNCPEDLPMYQHNVNPNRYYHSANQVELTYNASYPVEAYSKTLIEVDIKNPNKDKYADEDVKKSAAFVEHAFDDLIKCSYWSRREHMKLVRSYYDYGAALYMFDKESYKYTAIDFTKVKFPSGTSTNEKTWEYMFLEHDFSIFDLVEYYEDETDNWNKKALKKFLSKIIENNTSRGEETIGSYGEVDQIKVIDNIREGLTSCNLAQVCEARVSVTSVFWKKKDGTVARAIFTDQYSDSGHLYQNDEEYESFDEAFTIFPFEEAVCEIRMLRGPGCRVHALTHAYDRLFSKFLDTMEIASTLWINMDPTDLNKKILKLGTMNFGNFESVQQLPNALSPIIAGMAFLDQKIDEINSVKGLNKTELKGDGRGANLAQVLLNVEGRIHKHMMTRFLDRYTLHWRKVLKKILKIALQKDLRDEHPELKVRFYDCLMDAGVDKKLLQFDGEADKMGTLPTNWCVLTRRPDGSAFSPALNHTLELINPYLSSLPEAMFKEVMGKVMMCAFDDPSMLQGLEDPELAKEADLALAQTRCRILVTPVSSFDKNFDLEVDVDPQLSDQNHFKPFEATRGMDHVAFATEYLRKIQEVSAQRERREISLPTYEIRLFNLVMSTQSHLQFLEQDNIRKNKAEVGQLRQAFGQAFNLLRSVQSDANRVRRRKLEQVSENIAAQEGNSPEAINAQANLLKAQARMQEVQAKTTVDNVKSQVEVNKERRNSASTNIDIALKQQALQKNSLDFGPSGDTISQGGAGRPRNNSQ